jgi:queuine tRNA-ribosyltransferase
MEIQAALGSEIVMVFDECPPGQADFEATRKSLEMTARWARRSKDKFEELQNAGMDTGFLSEQPAAASGSELSGRQSLFGIIQGAGHLELRRESLDKTVEIGFDGYAIGGLSVGEEKSVMYDVIEFIAPQMPVDAPRYLMGVGTPEDLVEAVYRGVDMFDCVIPTRNGRTGSAFTTRGKINIRNARFAKDGAPLDVDCPCSVCRRYSRAYLRHLYQAGEMLAAIMISHHNLAFFLDTMRKVRDSIKLGSFGRFRHDFLNKIREGEAERQS